MNDTPRTDAEEKYVYGRVDRKWTTSDFARTLERELNQLRAAHEQAGQAAFELQCQTMNERDHHSAELCEIKCELALSTKTDDEKPIITIGRMLQTIDQLKAEVERWKESVAHAQCEEGKRNAETVKLWRRRGAVEIKSWNSLHNRD